MKQAKSREIDKNTQEIDKKSAGSQKKVGFHSQLNKEAVHVSKTVPKQPGSKLSQIPKPAIKKPSIKIKEERGSKVNDTQVKAEDEKQTGKEKQAGITRERASKKAVKFGMEDVTYEFTNEIEERDESSDDGGNVC